MADPLGKGRPLRGRVHDLPVGYRGRAEQAERARSAVATRDRGLSTARN